MVKPHVSLNTKKIVPVDFQKTMEKDKTIAYESPSKCHINFLCRIQKICNVLELILCYGIVNLMQSACKPGYSSITDGFVGTMDETYMYICAHINLAMTTIMLLSLILSSQATQMLLEKTFICILFWFTTTVLSIFSGMFLLLNVMTKGPELYSYEAKLVAALLSLVNCFLYSINLMTSMRSHKFSWMQQPPE